MERPEGRVRVGRTIAVGGGAVVALPSPVIRNHPPAIWTDHDSPANHHHHQRRSPDTFASAIFCSRRGDSVSRPRSQSRHCASTLAERRSFAGRRSIRLRGYDYRQSGVYFVTVFANQQRRIFGHMNDNGFICSELGRIVKEEWQRVERLRANVQMDLFVVMPNHLHGLVFIGDSGPSEDAPPNSPRAVSRSQTLQAGSLGAIIGQFKIAVTRQAKSQHLHPQHKIWQRNYHEHIVRSEQSLNELRQYIMTNPARWREDSLYVE